MTTKRALLIGIDNYHHIRTLDGCVNDSQLMRTVLVERFAFPEANIAQLLDGQATRSAMLAAFDALIASTSQDDVVVVHFAGHGSQMRDREGDEPSGFDSTLMPVDTGRAPRENRDITDDEIHQVLEALAAKTPHITVLVDACHSGTVTRDAFGAKTRSVEPDLRPIDELPPSPVPRAGQTRGASGASGWLPLGDKYVLIAGCRDDEESKEYFPPEGGGPHGALTYFLAQQLRAATTSTTYRDIFDIAAAKVTAYNPIQHPQMEGTADKSVFGVTDLSPVPFLRVAARTGQSVTVTGGQALGVTTGSTYAVHGPDAKRHDPAAVLGTLTVRSVTPFDATAEVVRETAPGAVAAGTRAFETAHAFDDQTLTVECVGQAATAAFADALRAAGVVAIAAPGTTASARIHQLPPRTQAGPNDPVPQAGAIAEPRWAVVDTSGALLMPLKPLDDTATVVDNLKKIARFRKALAFDNPAAATLRGKVSVEIEREVAGGRFEPAFDPATGLATIDEGQLFRVRLRNDHDQPLFATVIYFGTGSEIDVLASERLTPAVDVHVVRGTLSFPANYPFGDFGDALRGVDGLETFKVVVTQEEVDFDGLKQAAVRSVAPPPPFAKALQDLVGATRGFTPVPPPEEANRHDWTTVTRSFMLRRRSSALAADGKVAIGQAVVHAPAIVGVVGTGRTLDGRDETADFATTTLQRALADAEVRTGQTIAVSGARPSVGSRGVSGDADAPIALTLKPPPDGFGQMVLAADELGVVSWAFAPHDTAAVASGPASRGVDGRTTGRTYRIPSAVPVDTSGQPASRGLIGIVGKKVLKELVFPIVAPMLGQAGASAVHWLESQRWPYRVRTFTPDDYTAIDAAPIDPDGWRRLERGRALLLVHGTFSRSHLAFAGWAPDDVAALHQQYDGRVFAFDHLFLSEDPAENVRWLVSQLPDDTRLDLDIVCHSRGGLVSRVLAERQAELSLGARRLRVGKVVLVGVPNAGTPLADPAHVTHLLDIFTNLINFIPDSTGAPVLSMLVEFAKLAAIGALDNLAGLRSMHPTGEFARWINAPADTGDTRYFAVASNVAPAEPGLRHFLKARALTALLGGGNDLVVPSAGAFSANGGSLFPVADPLLLEGQTAVSHTQYFADPGVRRQILRWLAN